MNLNQNRSMAASKFIWGDEIEKITDPQFKQYLYLIYAKISRNPLFRFIKGEDHLQIWVSQYVAWKYPDVLCHHSPNEGKRGIFARWIVKLFIVQSMPDVMIYHHNKDHESVGLAIELKWGRNKATVRQLECMKRLLKAGWAVHIEDNFDACKAHIDFHLK